MIFNDDSVKRCPFCGKAWVRWHNSCPKNHKYFDNESLNDYFIVYVTERSEGN